MKASDTVRELIKVSGIPQKDIAEKMNMSPQRLNNRLRRDSLLADDFLHILEMCGYELRVRRLSDEKDVDIYSIEPHEFKRGIGKRLKMTVKGVKYDTYAADAICHTEIVNGCFTELYKKADGTYFVALYTNWPGGVDRISPIDEESALKIAECIT